MTDTSETAFFHHFNPSILRECDMRGTVDKTIFIEDAYAVGCTFGTIIARNGGHKVGLCYDGRHSSSFFANALAKGLMECGLDVENYGLGPTPLVYYALHERDLDGAIAITGSHNPYDHNGIKMTLRDGPFYGDDIKRLGIMARNGDVLMDAQPGAIHLVDIYNGYLARLLDDLNPQAKPLNIVWDSGNGVAGPLMRRLTELLPGTHTLLFDEVDGDFPNHHPDPVVEKNLADLKATVIQKGADFGIAFDGDGDRIGVVDRTGDVIWPDKLLVLYALEILQRKAGATVLMDVKCSKVTADLVAEHGGVPIMWKAGHSLMKAKMKDSGALLGGELSGHIFFKDGFYGHDDALYCAIRLINVIHALGDLSELKKMFPQTYVTPEIRFSVPEKNKFDYIKQAKDFVQTRLPAGNDVLDIDGIRVNNADGWWLLRASNTESALTARAEGLTPEGLQKQVEMLSLALKNAGCPAPDPLY